MLGHGKITFETPNVIDPGDQPPSRPSRTERKKKKYYDNPAVGDAVVRERPNYTDREDHRKRFKPPLTRTIKLDYRMSADDNEPNPQSDDVELTGHASIGSSSSRFQEVDLESISNEESHLPQSPLSPGMENARLFAATMLAETERRRSKRNIMMTEQDSSSTRSTRSVPMRWPRRGRRHEFGGLRPKFISSRVHDDDDNDSNEGLFKVQQQVRRRRLCLRVLIVLVTLSLVLCFSILAHKQSLHSYHRKNGSNADSLSTDNSSTSRLNRAMDALANYGISNRVLLDEPSSPQYQAVRWIAIEDSEQVDIPIDLEDMNQFQFVQRYVLAVLYFAMNGPRWNNALNFVSSRHECSWFKTMPDENDEIMAIGVSCDDRLEVRTLEIPFNKLEGRIPEEISHLKKLDFLNLKQNALTGSIPFYLKQLSLLKYLDLSHNQITGSIPDFVGDLDRLEVLGLGHNQLTGKVPESLGSLRLKTFAVDNNILTGDLSPVALMTNLRYLYADNNSFQGKLDNGLLADLAQLVEVDLSGNTFEADALPGYLFTHPRLRVLDLHDNQLAGTIPETIPGNTALQYLSLRENDISSSIPTQIHHLGALTHLDLEANAFTGSLPAEELSKITTLCYLFLGKNPIESATIPDQLSSLKSLRELSMDGLGLTGPIPEWIENFSDLRLLDLRTNSLTGSVSIDFSNLHQLTYLMLSGNLLTGPVPESLESRSNLVVVSLHQNGFTGETGGLCNAESVIQLLTTDCGGVTCPCCNDCCESEDCYEDVLWDTLENSEGDWEDSFERSDYGFNPHILFASEEPQGRD